MAGQSVAPHPASASLYPVPTDRLKAAHEGPEARARRRPPFSARGISPPTTVWHNPTSELDRPAHEPRCAGSRRPAGITCRPDNVGTMAGIERTGTRTAGKLGNF